MITASWSLLPDRLDPGQYHRVPRPDRDYRAGGSHGLLALVDTFGVLTRRRRVHGRKVKERIDKPLEAHFHMDFWLGVANTYRAVSQGVGTIQVSVSGIGERSGNVPLEDAIWRLSLYGVETGIDLSRLYGLSQLVQERAACPCRRTAALSAKGCSMSNPASSRVGSRTSARTTSSKPFPSVRVRGPDGSRHRARQGQRPRSVLIWFDQLELGPATNDQMIAILHEVKAGSLEKKGLLTEDEFGGIAQSVLSGATAAV